MIRHDYTYFFKITIPELRGMEMDQAAYTFG